MTTLRFNPITPSSTDPTLADPARWVREHGDVLWRFAIALVGDASIAEDLVQDALLSALRAADGFEGRSTERTWLLGILRNKVAEHWRRERRRGRGGVLSRMYDTHGQWRRESCGGPGAGPLDRDGLGEALWACVRALPPLLGEAFELHQVRGVPADEACRELGISTRNLWVRLHRARLLLRECLRARSIEGGAT